MRQKRVLSIQDISCTGRCSNTVALPILSASGVETAIIPTAVLSTHTGGFDGYTFKDLTDQMLPIKEHWKTLGRDFDAIYTGYLASNQIDIVKEYIDELKTDHTLVLVDPAMADQGAMYPGFDMEFAKKMAELVSKADITVPNLTEAYFMLNKKYTKEYKEKDIKDLLRELTNLGPRYAIISGVSFKKGYVGVYSYDKQNNLYDYFSTKNITGYFHGSGDIFASGILSGLMNGLDLKLSVRLAHDLVHNSILKTLEDEENDMRFGLHFERALPDFINEIQDMQNRTLNTSIFEEIL